MPDRLTVGRDTLNVVVSVRIRLWLLNFVLVDLVLTEAIRLDEELVLKTGAP